MANGGPPREEGGSLGPPPIQFRIPRDQFPRMHAARWLVVLVVLFVLFTAASIGKSIYADYLWFDSLGFASVFGKQIITKIWLFFAGALVFLALMALNLWLARRLAPTGLEESFIAEVEPATLRRIATIVMVAGSLFLAVIFGSVASGEWDTFLRFANRVSFGVSDPAFHHDASFYIFVLPLLHFIQGWLLGAAFVMLIGVVGVYAFTLSLQNFEMHLTRALKAHVGVLLIALLVLFAFGHLLSIWDLATTKNGVVQGATYTDLHARVPGYYVAIFFALVTAVAVGWSIFRESLIPAAAGGVTWIVVLILALGVYPGSVQRVNVDPNELAKEQPYIQRNIAATRAAYGLDRVDEQPFAADSTVNTDILAQNQTTINNIRLWDPRFTLDTFKQQQELRPLYTFNDVDVDRYLLNNIDTEVTLAARELSQKNLQTNQRTWVNIHTAFTHGFGAVMNAVNKLSTDGLPAYNLSDIPPQGTPKIDQPRIYYGMSTDEYVIVGAKQSEFDFDNGAQQQQNRYDGHGGVGIGSFFRKLIYSWEFGDTNLLISAQIQSGSRLLYRRNIRDRISHIAPFLTLDNDPYLVIADGKMYWFQDAYTTASTYPYSEASAQGFNYIRNSVKVVVDAYTGDVTFYLADGADPIARTYQKMFPSLLKPIDQMPASLRVHVRYPEDLFTIQANIFRTYHMTDPGQFYNKEDLWQTPREGARGGNEPVVPYYVIMQLPGSTQPEFVLIRPFSAANKANAVAWMGARSDGANYGKISVYRFPTDRLTPGPAQVESSIDSQPQVSQTISLLNVQGSHIIRGNLLMIPIGSSYLYVEPVYLEAEQNPKPAVIAVIVYAGENVYMEPTLQQALDVAVGNAPARFAVSGAATSIGQAAKTGQTPPGVAIGTASPTPTGGIVVATPATGPRPVATDVPGLVREIADADAQAQQRLKEGDFAGYGQQEARLRAALDRLQTLLPTPTASATNRPQTITPTPAASPAPTP
ncbi:MAG: UPF0182 family membrane protein [Dehalococcoidia bacterium]